MKQNSKLHTAKKAKNDEFYTQLKDIEAELQHYTDHFKGKVVYCNCDTKDSKFVEYFETLADYLQIKDLYFSSQDFRSDISIEYLKLADIVVTNPPFSLFREYVAQLIEYDKKFLIIGNHNAITYKEIFPLIKDNRMWLGVSPRSMSFRLPDNSISDVNACWFTNMEYEAPDKKKITLTKTYEGNESDYPKYDNYDAINVDRVKDIPIDYYGYMGVPITFLDKYNPNQFEIIDGIGRYSMIDGPTEITKGTYLTKINGKPRYARLIIKKKQSCEFEIIGITNHGNMSGIPYLYGNCFAEVNRIRKYVRLFIKRK